MFQIEDFYRTSDGNDWWPATMRAMDTWVADEESPYRGFQLQFRPREYIFSRSIDVIRGMSLIGSGGGGRFGGAILRFPDGVSGIIVHQMNNIRMTLLGFNLWQCRQKYQCTQLCR